MQKYHPPGRADQHRNIFRSLKPLYKLTKMVTSSIKSKALGLTTVNTIEKKIEDGELNL